VRDGLPPYVYLGDANHVGGPGFLGKAHEAYIPGQKAANLGLCRNVSLERLGERRSLLAAFDSSRRDLDDLRGSREGMDAFESKAMEMLTTNKARDAFDLSKEPDRVRQKYGRGIEYLTARRLVEARRAGRDDHAAEPQRAEGLVTASGTITIIYSSAWPPSCRSTTARSTPC